MACEIQRIDSAIDYVLVGAFGYVHYEGRETPEKPQPSDHLWSAVMYRS